VTEDDAKRRETGELLDAEAMRVFAHPLRIKLLGSLRHDGPATSAILARLLHTNTGQTSFHLRILNQAGFVEEMPEKGSARERWWRATSAATVWRRPSEYSAPEVAAAMSDFERAANVVWSQLHDEYLSDRGRWSAAWVDAASSMDVRVRLTPERLTLLLREFEDLVRKHDLGEDEAPDAATVVLLLHAFPRQAQEEDQPPPNVGWHGFGSRNSAGDRQH
jgi:DNA-binding transcriptional ArsR family regulator